jgi:metal transporter CNNM
VKQAVKRGLTQRLRQRVGMGDSDSSDEEKDTKRSKKDLEEATEDGEATLREDGTLEKDFASEKPNKAKSSKRGRKVGTDVEKGEETNVNMDEKQGKKTGFHLLPKAAASMTSMSMLEQSMPADAVLTKEGANEVWNSNDFPIFNFLGMILTSIIISSYKTSILL